MRHPPIRGGFPREREAAPSALGGGDTPAPPRSAPRGRWLPSRGWGAGLLRRGAPSGFPEAPGASPSSARERARARAGRRAGGAGRRWGALEWSTQRRGGAPGSGCSPGGGSGAAQLAAQPARSAYLSCSSDTRSSGRSLCVDGLTTKLLRATP